MAVGNFPHTLFLLSLNYLIKQESIIRKEANFHFKLIFVSEGLYNVM